MELALSGERSVPARVLARGAFAGRRSESGRWRLAAADAVRRRDWWPVEHWCSRRRRIRPCGRWNFAGDSAGTGLPPDRGVEVEAEGKSRVALGFREFIAW